MITINIDKAREIGHALRREARQAELAPLDAQINYSVADAAQVAALEAQRQVIRDKYTAIQLTINEADSPEAILAALSE
ncbi:MAG: hypothetical protein AB7U59_15245 [Desulfovibrionaceae bacterium]|jgi:hypothetical protein